MRHKTISKAVERNMAKQKPIVRLRTFGLYSQWDSESKALPDFVESTTRIPARVDIEFGLVVNIVGGKNLPLHYCIDHPGIEDEHGDIRAPFEGIVHIKTNDWDFYLGDTIWEPIKDKVGLWRMSLELDGKVVAEQSFEVFAETCTENDVLENQNLPLQPSSTHQATQYKWVRLTWK